MPRLLNLGCGSTFHPEWVNVDVAPKPPHVLGYDLRHGVPFAENLFDVVYHSHVLEHFSRQDAASFLRECLRVLAPGGLLRVAVPDMEGIARAYLQALELAEQDAAEQHNAHSEADARHEWMLVELVDQLTRHVRGGEMMEFWRRNPVPAREFILSRVGAEARHMMDNAAPSPPRIPATPPSPLEVGRFRLSGECHLWMYDRRSLARLLREIGFTDIRVTSAGESALADFARYGLDVEPDGSVRKPDSLFMEARKPQDSPVARPRVVSFCMKHGGGAGGAAHRLHQGLQAVGVSSLMYVVHSEAPAPGVAVLPASGGATLSQEETSGALVHSAWPALFSTSRARLAAYPNRPTHCEIFTESSTQARISELPGMETADIFQLHWIAGTVDICRDVDFLRGRPLVWTLHDMNPITGGCHYAESCRGFEKYCGRCPQLGSSEENDYSREQWRRKKIAYRELDITVVTPSQWLAGEVRRSSLLGKVPVHVIPNSVPTDVFKPLQRAAIRNSLGLAEQTPVLLFGADYLHTRRKGFAELVTALDLLRAAGSPVASVAPVAPVLLTFGHAETVDLNKLPLRCLHLGVLRTAEEVALACNAADCLVIPSLEDNLPNVVLEALACGLPVAGFATGGIPDMVEEGVTGRLAPTGDCPGLAQAIAALCAMPASARQQMRLQCRQTALARYTPLHQARAYQALYQEVLARRQGEKGIEHA